MYFDPPTHLITSLRGGLQTFESKCLDQAESNDKITKGLSLPPASSIVLQPSESEHQH